MAPPWGSSLGAGGAQIASMGAAVSLVSFEPPQTSCVGSGVGAAQIASWVGAVLLVICSLDMTNIVACKAGRSFKSVNSS